MTRASELFGGGGGVNFISPKEFIGRVVAAGNIRIYEGTTSRASNAASGFFTEINNRGVNVNTDFSAGVAKTILNTTGKGWLSHVVGPTAPGAGETTTITITRDGVATTLTFSPASGDRAVLGPVRGISDFVTSAVWVQPVQVLNAGKTALTGGVVGEAPFLPDWDFMRLHGVPVLRFEQSLLVQITHSTNVTNTAADGRQSGVCYMKEQ